MSLRLEVRLLGGESKTINIRNPAATLSNLRASIAMSFRLAPASFRLTHTSLDLETETAKLSEVGLKDGDEITVVLKRDREGPEASVPPPSSSPARAALLAAPRRAVAPAVPAEAAPPAPPPFRLERLVELGWSREEATRILAASAGDVRRATELLLQSLYTQAPAAAPARRPRAAPLVVDHAGSSDEGGDSEEDEDDEEEDEEEGEVYVGEDDEEDDVDEEGEEGEEGEDDEFFDEESVAFIHRLLELPNAATLPQRFRDDPSATMREIQAQRPDIFQMIAQHSEVFMRLMQQADIAGAPGEEEALIAHMQNVHTGGVRGVAPRAPAPLTDADNSNIESLMGLGGFTREQALDAYLRCGRNPDRAAALLFGM